MSPPATSHRQPHDDPALLREALNLTTARTGYALRLIEKDYYCTLLLEYLAAADPSLVFKGGTCLAKVHAGFYRLSEDMDFSIPIAVDATRSQRRRAADTFKNAVEALPVRLPIFRPVQPCAGANNSAQYAALVGYPSLVGETADTIKIEVGLREPLLAPAISGAAQTLLLDPITEQPLLKPVAVNCLSQREAYAEKFRAALSRREAAIRDFYDIDHAVRLLGLQAEATELIDWVRRKLSVPGNDAADVSSVRLEILRGQIETQLRPVLREAEFRQFDLERAFKIVAEMARRIG
jgi:predicted nucleotidyltransferase component of viral defense system